MTGDIALPRDNGQFVFDEPWQRQAFGLAVTLVDSLALPWREFQRRLIHAIDDDPNGPYYERWVVALESLAADYHVVDRATVDAHAQAFAANTHDHD
jgi:nitrile hydratase accessory protein